MSRLSISRAWEETKACLAADGKLIVAVALALILLPQAVLALVAPPEALSGTNADSGSTLFMVVASLAALAGQIAIARLAIGPSTKVGDAIIHGLKRLLPLFVAFLVLGLGLFLAAIPLVLLFAGFGALDAAAAGGTGWPGMGAVILILLVLAIVIGARFVMIIPVAAAEPGGPIHILQRSWDLASGHFLKLIGFVLLIMMVVIIFSVAMQFGGGTLIKLFFDIEPFSIGALLYGLLFGAVQAAYVLGVTVLLARIYLQLAGPDQETVSVPSSGT